MSCPICGISGVYQSGRTKQREPVAKKWPTSYSTCPPYAGPQDTLTLANERALDYPYIHAKIYQRTPSAAYLQLKAQHAEEFAREERHSRRPPTTRGGSNVIREALCHLQTAERLLTH